MHKLDNAAKKYNPRIAVIVPCYQHGHMIQDCFDSIAEQDYKNKFIVVIDDASPDGSYGKILESLFDVCIHENYAIGKYKDVDVYVLRNKENKQRSATRNIAIKFAWNRADAFAMLDADDKYLPGKLTKSIEKLAIDPKVIGLVYCDVLIEDTRSGRVVQEFRAPFNRYHLEYECIVSNAPVINKIALDAVGLYDEELLTAEDWDLWLRITEKFPAIHLAETLQVYRVTGLNASFTIPKEVWQKQWNRVQTKLRQRLNKQ